MKSIETSAARAWETADTANASMLNTKKSFFIVVRNQAFDFSAPGFIQLLIRKASPPCACTKHLTPNGQESKRIKRKGNHGLNGCPGYDSVFSNSGLHDSTFVSSVQSN